MAAKKGKKLRITLVKSAIGYPTKQRGTIRALGLRRLRQSVVKDDSASIRGMIEKVNHLIEVEEA
jgi:large subunit ribosomal protein L30